MRKVIFIIVLAVSLGMVSLASASTPSWCQARRGGVDCRAASEGFISRLEYKYPSFAHARRHEGCPTEQVYDDKASCMAYWSYKGVRHFASGSVSESQADYFTGTLNKVTSWRLRWHHCSLGKEAAVTARGSLQANTPCDSLPLTPQYYLNIEMGGAEGLPDATQVGWQFAGSGAFAEDGLALVAFDPCHYGHGLLTCTDSQGDSMRYHYPNPAKTPLYQCSAPDAQIAHDQTNIGCGSADLLLQSIFQSQIRISDHRFTTSLGYARHWYVTEAPGPRNGPIPTTEFHASSGAYRLNWIELDA